MSIVYRAKYLAGIKKLIDSGKLKIKAGSDIDYTIKMLYNKSWVVYAKSLLVVQIDESEEHEYIKLSSPELKSFRRPYSIPMDFTNEFHPAVPDFKKLSTLFLKNLPTYQKQTMIWSIGYSRLENSQKIDLLKKYYSTKTHISMYRVCLRNKNIACLQWMLEL